MWTLLSIALLLLASKIAEEICHRLKQPSVVGYIIAGIVLGPTGLAVVSASPDIQLFFELGAIFLFFLIGFEEIDVPGLMTVFRKKLFYAAVLAFIIPLAFSFQFFVMFGYAQVTALAISAVFSITSLGVLAKVLMDLGYIRKPIGLVTFTTGAIVEFLGLLFVSIAIKMLDNPSNMLLDLVFFAATMIVYFIVAAVVGIYAMPRLLGTIRKYGTTKEISLGILIGVILLLSSLPNGADCMEPSARCCWGSCSRRSQRRSMLRSPRGCRGLAMGSSCRCSSRGWGYTSTSRSRLFRSSSSLGCSS